MSESCKINFRIYYYHSKQLSNKQNLYQIWSLFGTGSQPGYPVFSKQNSFLSIVTGDSRTATLFQTVTFIGGVIFLLLPFKIKIYRKNTI